MQPVDHSDIQGLLKTGFGRMPETRYHLLRIRDAAAARAWLSRAPVTTAEKKNASAAGALQVAITASGLRELGTAAHVVERFAPEFLAGMTDPSRSRRLGDTGDSAPEYWQWGGPGDPIHLLAILMSVPGGMDAWASQVYREPWHAAFEVREPLVTSNHDGREPFGFIDGISQPEPDWDRTRDTSRDQIHYTNRVALGEFLLGYPNEYGKYTDRPLLEASEPGAAVLPPAENDAGKFDLGLNGTYLVLRQLEQDVRGFWQFVNSRTNSAEARVRLAEAMVGRRLEDGSSLVAGTNTHGGPDNDFTFDSDSTGVRCPFGAHIRRANPRNTDLPGHPASALSRTLAKVGFGNHSLRGDLMASTRFHRLLRRGREYGPELTQEQAVVPGAGDEPARGIHFVCLNANISRQFEFVQNAWIMSGKFDGLPDESDPLLGAANGRFSLPREGGCPQRITGIPRFITVRGGEYFFLPGLRALRYLAGQPAH